LHDNVERGNPTPNAIIFPDRLRCGDDLSAGFIVSALLEEACLICYGTSNIRFPTKQQRAIPLQMVTCGWFFVGVPVSVSVPFHKKVKA
jgi:hypothetical protein